MTNILLKTDDDVEKLTEVADAVQATEGKVQLVDFDKKSELVDGWLFGASGRFKLWIKPTHGEVEKYETVTDPLTYPSDEVLFNHEEMKVTRSGRIARLKVTNTEGNQ